MNPEEVVQADDFSGYQNVGTPSITRKISLHK